MKTVFQHHRQSDPTSRENFGPCLSLHPNSTLRTQMQQRDISIMLHRKKDRQREGNRLAQDNRQPQQTKKSNLGLLTSCCPPQPREVLCCLQPPEHGMDLLVLWPSASEIYAPGRGSVTESAAWPQSLGWEHTECLMPCLTSS